MCIHTPNKGRGTERGAGGGGGGGEHGKGDGERPGTSSKHNSIAHITHLAHRRALHFHENHLPRKSSQVLCDLARRSLRKEA